MSRFRIVQVLAITAVMALMATGQAAAQLSDPGGEQTPQSATQQPPSESDFVEVRLAGESDLEDPFEIDILPDGRVMYIQRIGQIKLIDPDSLEVTTIGDLELGFNPDDPDDGLPVERHSDGLIGLALDPDFADNGWVYLHWSDPDVYEIHVSRFDFDFEDSMLDMDSESRLLTYETDRYVGIANAHMAGSVQFGPDGLLYIATGDNTEFSESDNFTPIDEREGWEYNDAQRSSGNTNDLRGKILRIDPTDDGGYEIPEGNLFPPDVSDPDLTRPEIYAMGLRNPFRIDVDPITGALLIADYGPDAGEADPERGPEGLVEFHIVREAANLGWPYCHGPYPYVDYDFETGESGDPFDCDNLVNDSPNNTGLEELPPAIGPDIWYGYGESEEFPEMEDGGAAPMAGPVYHYDPDLDSDTKFPEFYDGKWFIYEYARSWILTVDYDEDGVQSIDSFPFRNSERYIAPFDMEFGPDGSLYVLDFGAGSGVGRGDTNTDAGIYRIDYVGDGGPGDPDPPTEQVCDQFQGGATFPDSPGSGHREFIDCLAELGIVRGFVDGTYGPRRDVSRQQLATFVVNALEITTDVELDVGDERFPDVAIGSEHGVNVHKLANAGIIRGYEDGTFRPRASVSRDQTARFVVNALELAIGESLPRSGESFDDVTSTQYVPDIDKLVTAGVISGYPDGTFRPREPVTRAQMARFIGAGLDVLAQYGALTLPGAQPVPIDEIGLVLFTVRDQMPDDPGGTLEALVECGYQNVEPSGAVGNYYGLTGSELASYTDEAGLNVPSIGVSLDNLRNDVEGVVADAEALGADYARFSGSGDWTMEDYEAMAAELNVIGADLAEQGITLAYHNHGFEFETQADGVSGYDVLVRGTDPDLVTFELDVYWAESVGASVIDLFEEYPGRFELLHLKDMVLDDDGVPTFADVGEGVIDFPEIFANREAAGVQWSYVENDNPSPDGITSACNSMANLMEMTY